MSDKYVVYMYDFGSGTPRYYIGSKSKCSFDTGKLLDCTGKEYFGSSSSTQYWKRMKTEKPNLIIIEECKDSKHALTREIFWLRAVEANTNPEYFNMFVPPDCSFTWSNYGTFRHKEKGTYKRLPRNHPLVKSGVYVGTTAGLHVHTDEFKRVLSERTKNNYYFGGKPNTEASARGLKKFYASPAGIKERKKRSERTRKLFKGKPKSPEQRRNMSIAGKGKNKIVLWNINTGARVNINQSRWEREYKHKPDWRTMLFNKNIIENKQNFRVSSLWSGWRTK